MRNPDLQNREKLRLDEILQLCADYERQIEEEQIFLFNQRVQGSNPHQGENSAREEEDSVVTYTATASVSVVEKSDEPANNDSNAPMSPSSVNSVPLTPNR